MKHFFASCSLFFAIVIPFFYGCNSYDDSELREKIDKIDSRIKTLEDRVEIMNGNIASWQKTISALENSDQILSVTPLEDGTGWRIVFSRTGEIVIYHGKDGSDGEDGATPIIGVKKDSDNDIYYWTLNGEFLLDDNGDKIQANGITSAPIVRISSDGKHYEISFDNKTWLVIGDIVDGAPSPTIFESVEDNANEVTFYLTNGGKIVIPKVQLFAININGISYGVSAGSIVDIPYTITAADEGTYVDGIGNNGYKVNVINLSTSSGIISIETPNPLVEGKAIILAFNSKGTTSGKVLSFEQGNLVLVTDGASIDAKGGIVSIKIKTNLNYYVDIPSDANWISQVDTKALRDETLTFSVKENTGVERSTTIKLLDDYDNTLQSFTVVQAAGSGSSSQNDGYINNIDDWEYDTPITF